MARIHCSFQSQFDTFQIRSNFMSEEDKVVYNRGSIKIKVIRGEMEVGEIGRRGVAAVGPSVRS